MTIHASIWGGGEARGGQGLQDGEMGWQHQQNSLQCFVDELACSTSLHRRTSLCSRVRANPEVTSWFVSHNPNDLVSDTGWVSDEDMVQKIYMLSIFQLAHWVRGYLRSELDCSSTQYSSVSCSRANTDMAEWAPRIENVCRAVCIEM